MQVFQTFWHGGQLSPYEMLSLKSFLDHGHRVELYTYEDHISAPDGVLFRPATEVLPREDFFTYDNGPNRGSPACFANLFRYRLLADRGGWWIDTDVVCLSASVSLAFEFFAFEDDEFINVAVIKFQQNDSMMIACYEEALCMGRKVKWGETGPRLITEMARRMDRVREASGPDVCYPISPMQALAPLKPSMKSFCQSRVLGASFLHLWNSSLLNNGVDKLMRPPEGSYMRELFERHGIDGWCGEYVVPAVLKYDVLS